MSKVILKFNAPESCMRCVIRMTCLCTVRNKEAKHYTRSRHPDCPLQIEEEKEEPYCVRCGWYKSQCICEEAK